MKTIVRSLATANPARYATQEEAYHFLRSHFPLTSEEDHLYRRILLEGPIRGRYVGVDYDEQACEDSPDQLIARFQKQATLIAVQAARRAMEQAGVGPGDIGGLVVNTCTGYLCPGLSSYLAEELALPATTRTMDLAGMGCGAAIPNLECTAGLLGRRADKAMLSVSAEICSATIFMGPQPDLVVSNSIFGDGAAAAVLDLAENGHPHGLLRIVDFESVIIPRHRDDLRFRTEQGRLRNTLSIRVPIIAGRAVRRVADQLLERNGLTPDQVRWWAIHPGGTAVLERIAATLGLSQEAMRFSNEIFRDYGNMSSPSVMFVLRRILDHGQPSPGDKGMLLSFGAGFTAFGALVEFS